MRSSSSPFARTRAPISFALLLAIAGIAATAIEMSRSSHLAAQGASSLEASIFTYDGHDFIRTRTTLVTEAGKPAVNTKLDRDTPAFKALSQKHSYTGDATVFGKRYDASYAPLTDQDGRLTGALFVAIHK